MEKNLRVKDIDPGILYQIQILLGGKRWQDLLKKSSINSLDFSKYVEEHGKNARLNLARSILDYCADVPVEVFIKWLEAIHLEKALLMLKKDEPLKIIKEPERILEAIVGQERLTLSCKAQGFPTPTYCWLHEGKKLSEGPILEISPVRFEDAGMYQCSVSHTSRSGVESCVFTSGTRLKVEPPKVSNLPEIVHQPYSPTTEKVHPGSTFTLTCEGRSKDKSPLTYQWYCNDIILEGEVSPKLDVGFHSNGDTFRIECMVCNKHGCVMSNSVILECEDTQCYAEDKYALLIGNSQYDYLPHLMQPTKDVCLLSEQLQLIEFKTLCFQNLTCKEMRQAIKLFCGFLRPGVYALFYFAGHGYQQFEKDCALLGKESKGVISDEAVSPNEILDCMQERNPEVNVILIDTCREPLRGQHSARANVERTFQPDVLRNTVFGFATSFMHGSYEIEGQSSIFVQYLKTHIKECIPIWHVLLKIMEEVEMDPAASLVQYPSTAGSLARPIKLTDTIIGHGELFEYYRKNWQAITGMPKQKVISLDGLGIITITFSPYQNTFCNAMTMDVSMTSTSECSSAHGYSCHIKFFDRSSNYEEHSISADHKMKPCFSISLLDLQCKEVIKARLEIKHKYTDRLHYAEDLYIKPAIAQAYRRI